MIFKPYYYFETGCAAYQLGCGGLGLCAVVDPHEEDVDAYLAFAASKGRRITHVVDTHIHADHRSGGVALARKAGAAYCLHESANVAISFEPLRDGQELELGKHRLRWFDAPHVPHAWECGLMLDTVSKTFFCGDLFTQPGHGERPLTDGDILGPSEGFRQALDYYAHAPQTDATLERFAREQPTTLAAMHGSAWRGDGAALLRSLAASLRERRPA